MSDSEASSSEAIVLESIKTDVQRKKYSDTDQVAFNLVVHTDLQLSRDKELTDLLPITVRESLLVSDKALQNKKNRRFKLEAIEEMLSIDHGAACIEAEVIRIRFTYEEGTEVYITLLDKSSLVNSGYSIQDWYLVDLAVKNGDNGAYRLNLTQIVNARDSSGSLLKITDRKKIDVELGVFYCYSSDDWYLTQNIEEHLKRPAEYGLIGNIKFKPWLAGDFERVREVVQPEVEKFRKSLAA